MSETHEFALYYENLKAARSGDTITLVDTPLIGRILNVLRLRVDDTVILFDHECHIKTYIELLEKKKIVCKILSTAQNKPLDPKISIALPILKRDAFEQAIYNITELGGTEIQLLETKKTQRKWGGDKEFERLKRISVAAAEQSKNFCMPPIHEPISLEQLLQQQDGTVVFCDMIGSPISDLFDRQSIKQTDKLTIIIGPEGDFTPEEKELLKADGIQSYKLTPTVLRAVQAISIALGYLRCL